MDRELLVRMYNVGLGDCIYLRVPDGDTDRHIMIDCGNKFGSEADLKRAVEDVESQLPNKQLDLLVVTHSHEDHVRGFDHQWFGKIDVKQIWLSAGMDPDHPQAEKSRQLQALALMALDELRSSDRPEMRTLATTLFSLSKSEGMETIQKSLPQANGIKPLYVHADTPAAKLELFTDPAVQLKVLAPMRDIDHFYLGKTDEALLQGTPGSLLRSRLAGLSAKSVDRVTEGRADKGGVQGEQRRLLGIPNNISAADFARLKDRLLDNAMAFVLKAGHLVNNTSVVLLLEWYGRRLLFTGDAEAKTAYGGKFMKGRSNGSWNVMWHERREELDKALDFLKVGHHGSHNATPWTAKTFKGGPHPLNEILDVILPPAAENVEPTAKAVVSTERTNSYRKIPEPLLMQELGHRVGNTRQYNEPSDKGHFVPNDVPQPQRTDLEHQETGKIPQPFVDVRLTPASQ